MSEEKPWPCSIPEGGLLKRCWALEAAIEKNVSESSSSRGVFLRELISLDTGKDVSCYVVLKTGSLTSKPLVMNFCPFCGTNIHEHLRHHMPGTHDATQT
jgi:hypothetical protein